MMGKFILALCVLCLIIAMAIPALAKPNVHVYGAKERAAAVANYLSSKGVSVVAHQQDSEVMGRLNGKPWPGVVVTTTPDIKESGIFIPVSDRALESGLCSDQVVLLDQFIQVKPKQTKGKQLNCPEGMNCTPPILFPDTLTRRDYFGPKFDLVEIQDPHKPKGAVASKMEVFPSGPRVQISRYNGRADGQAYLAAILRAKNELLPRLPEVEKYYEGQNARGTCLYVLHMPH